MSEVSLFVVATPIGNLEDLSDRAKRVLNEVDFILCEDTRETSKLLRYIGVSKELVSFNAQSESKKIEKVISRINGGEICAIVSDSGTPCISDPGVRLINRAHHEGIKVSGIPGPNAAILALSISGLPTDSFVFEGFLPQKKGRQSKLRQLAEEERNIVIYESVYRVEKLLQELSEHLPNRFVVVSRELTKVYEEIWRGYPSELSTEIPNRVVKGEFVIIIAPKAWKQNK